MEIFTRKELKILAQAQDGPCVSLYLPTHRVPTEIQQDRLRLKNLLRQAEDALLAAGIRASEARKLLKPAESLLPETPFWRGQKDGLAVFLSPVLFRHYHLPIECPELAVVTDRFHLKPLLSLLGGEDYYVLALSQNEVRFFQASRFSISEIAPSGLPRSLAEALKYDDPQKQLQFHTGTQRFTGERAAMFHGHGVGTDDTKTNILRFCQQVDRSLAAELAQERAPLVVAAVDYLWPIYREANSYAGLIEEGVAGNPEGLSPDELKERAWEIVEPHFEQTRETAASRYRELKHTGKVSHELKEVVPAAYHGRIDVLFVAVGLQSWGSYEPATGDLLLYPEAMAGAEDLLDFAAVHTLIQDGTVFALDPETVPDGPPGAAVFRY